MFKLPHPFPPPSHAFRFCSPSFASLPYLGLSFFNFSSSSFLLFHPFSSFVPIFLLLLFLPSFFLLSLFFTFILVYYLCIKDQFFFLFFHSPLPLFISSSSCSPALPLHIQKPPSFLLFPLPLPSFLISLLKFKNLLFPVTILRSTPPRLTRS